jgi:hypothetical protein
MQLETKFLRLRTPVTLGVVLLGDGGEDPTAPRPPAPRSNPLLALLGRKTMMLYREVASESIER